MDIPKKKKDPFHPETFFLPPLKMILSVFDKHAHQHEPQHKEAETQETSDEETVTKLIEKLSEKEE